MIKRILPLVLLILIGCSEPEPIPIHELFPREDNLMYEKHSNNPFSGKVWGRESYVKSFISQEDYVEPQSIFDTLVFYDGTTLDYVGQFKGGKRIGSWYYYHQPLSNEKIGVPRRLKYIEYYRDNELLKVDFYSFKNIIGTYLYENGIVTTREKYELD